MKQLKCSLALVILLIVLTGQFKGQVKTAVEQRANDVISMFQSNPGDYQKCFSKTFLEHVPPDKLASTFNKLFTDLGKCVKYEVVALDNSFRGKFNFIFEKNSSVSANLSVDSTDAHLIIGLWLSEPTSLAANFDEVLKEFKALPGESSLLITKLSANGLEPVISYNPEKSMAIGSAFKLYILSELLKEVNKGERSWKDVAPLRAENTSLPSGVLQNYPAGMPMTLHSLAAFMISISDNTAADNLLSILGRENVEKMLSLTGHSKPEMNMPFLSTLEMFKLKGIKTDDPAREYLSKKAEDRRTFLNSRLLGLNKSQITFPGTPTYIDSIEWFASVTDLCKVMNWIRINSETDPGSTARGILAINPGLPVAKDKWIYTGYKGGSEPGVINMTYLLQSVKGTWYALSASWNNPKEVVNDAKFAGLVRRVIQQLGGRPE